MKTKSQFVTVDFRNAKYQGFTKGQQIQGIGIFIDNQYMLALSKWKKQTPHGSTLIVFPNRQYFYGTIINNQLIDLGVYVMTNGQKIIFNCQQGQPKCIAYLQNQKNIIQILKTQKGFTIANIYNNQILQQQKIKILSNILKTNYPANYQTCKSFVKEFIQAQHKDHSGSTFIGFKQEHTLGVQFNKDYNIKSLGNYSTAPINLQFGRIYSSSRGNQIKIQQGKFSEPANIKTFMYPDYPRPPQAYKITDNYFKIGTNFTNKFLNFNQIAKLSQFFKSIKEELQKNIYQYGQRILKMSQKNVIQGQINYSQLKNQIDKMKNRKYKGRVNSRQSPSNKSSNYYQRISQQKIKPYIPVQQQSRKQFSQLKKRRQKVYLPENQHQISVSPFSAKKSQEKIVNREDKYRKKYQVYQNNDYNKNVHQTYKNSVLRQQQSPYKKISQFASPYQEKYSKSPIKMPYRNEYQYQQQKSQPLIVNRTNTIINRLNTLDLQNEKNKFENYQRYKNRNKYQNEHKEEPNRDLYRRNYKYL